MSAEDRNAPIDTSLDSLRDAQFQQEITAEKTAQEKAKFIDIIEAAQNVIKDSHLYEQGGKPCVVISYSAFKKLSDALRKIEA